MKPMTELMTELRKMKDQIRLETTDPRVDHPSHYGGADDPYEAIKVIEAWGLGFHLGNTLKYIRRAFAKGDPVVDLKKARFYLDRAIQRLEEGEGVTL